MNKLNAKTHTYLLSKVAKAIAEARDEPNLVNAFDVNRGIAAKMLLEDDWKLYSRPFSEEFIESAAKSTNPYALYLVLYLQYDYMLNH